MFIRSICTRSSGIAVAMYQLIDIGANLCHPSFATDIDAVINRAKQAGLIKIMVTGTDVKGCIEVAQLAKQHKGFLYWTAGIHPHNAKEFTDETISQLNAFASELECVAIGECGLDFNRNFSPQDQQKKAFEAQVELACQLNKSLFIHERDAHDDMVTILSRHQSHLPPAVLHCFTGTAEQARKYIEMGFYIGITGFLFKDRSNDGVQYALKNGIIPLDRLLLETDAPYMYPKLNAKTLPINAISIESKRWLNDHCSFKRNEPCSLPAICELIANFMQIPASRIAEQTTQNACKIYGLK